MNVPTLLLSHPECLQHIAGPGHPESPERLASVLKSLEDPKLFPDLLKREASIAEREVIYAAHDPAYVDAIFSAVPASGFRSIDPDTGLSAGSGIAALRAAGAMTEAVDSVLTDKAHRAFCAVRPPGHHAERSRAMGFCLFNNIAIAALHARKVHGLDKIAVVDFDVHHGNGTQNIFKSDNGLFFASTHQSPFYPGTGSQRQVTPNLVNIPLPSGTDGVSFRKAWNEEVLPALHDFAPELVLISAGFDGHVRDPLAGWRLEVEDFSWVTHAIVEVASASPAKGKIVSVQEGGYDLESLVASATAHVAALIENTT